MRKIFIGGILVLVIVVSMIACSNGGNSTNISEDVEDSQVDTQIASDTFSISSKQVTDSGLIQFEVGTDIGDIVFMAYDFGGETYVRSNICPPCRSVGFTLQGDTLVCDSCATQFDAVTGVGIRGGCVNYPKAQVDYRIVDDTIVMDIDNLVTAYQNTLKPGLP